jgi:hypothetical protein
VAPCGLGEVAREKSTHHADALAGTRMVPIMEKNVEGLFLVSISRTPPGSARVG